MFLTHNTHTQHTHTTHTHNTHTLSHTHTHAHTHTWTHAHSLSITHTHTYTHTHGHSLSISLFFLLLPNMTGRRSKPLTAIIFALREENIIKSFPLKDEQTYWVSFSVTKINKEEFNNRKMKPQYLDNKFYRYGWNQERQLLWQYFFFKHVCLVFIVCKCNFWNLLFWRLSVRRYFFSK